MPKKNRCVAFNIKTIGIIYEKDHIISLFSFEVENFKLTSKMFHIYLYTAKIIFAKKYLKVE